jgi:hypothetical protein
MLGYIKLPVNQMVSPFQTLASRFDACKVGGPLHPKVERGEDVTKVASLNRDEGTSTAQRHASFTNLSFGPHLPTRGLITVLPPC